MTQSNNVTSFPKKDNVLQFPKFEGFAGNTPEGFQQNLETNVSNWIENILPVVCSATFNEISKFGLGLFDPALLYDMTMVQEACRSLMLASVNLTHPFQSLSRDVMEIDEYGGVNIWTVGFEPDVEDEEDHGPANDDSIDPIDPVA